MEEAIPEILAKRYTVRGKPIPSSTASQPSKRRTLLAFIGPYTSVRLSPVHEARARINLLDEFAIEEALRVLSASGVRKAFLLVNSLGGGLDSSYKIACAVRQAFDEITTFIPHVAANGGTLLALTGNRIVMGAMSNITALDVQIVYKTTTISAGTLMRSFKRCKDWFEKMTPDEAPYPMRALTDKLDPFLMEEWSGLMTTSQDYVAEILQAVGYENPAGMAEKLVTKYPSRSYVIRRQKAVELGLRVEDAAQSRKAWDVMRYWLSQYLFEQTVTHCVRYAFQETQAGGRNRPTRLPKRETSMPKKKHSEFAQAAWGPIDNPIDKETLELWRRLDPDTP